MRTILQIADRQQQDGVEMTENVLIEFLQRIQREGIRFGTADICFTFHDGKIVSYTISTTQRHNLQPNQVKGSCT